MNLESFSKLASLSEQTELEKVRRLAFYHHKANGKRQFTLIDVPGWFEEFHFHAPNKTRLKTNLDKSSSFVRVGDLSGWKLHVTDLDELQADFPGISSKSEDVVATDCILSRSFLMLS